MPEIILQHITKRWDTFYAVDNLNLVIDDNAFVTLLGPSGCGKTTTLRMIAGLETPTSGRITIGGVTVFDSEKGINIPPNKRRVGFLFQNYALWPNMTVYQNISFGLSNMKEEIPSVDTAAFHTAALIRMLRRPDDLRDIYDSSRDKNGRIDGGRLCLRLIDEYDVSEHTAKALMGYRLFDRKDPAAAAAEESAKLEESLQKLREKRRAMGEELNDRFEILRGGQVQKSVRRLTGEEIDLRVRRVARIVKIGMFMERYPSELSGGQQQRVAIARTLAPEPKVLFMDEPLSNLDAKLRLEMRSELQRLHIETGSTFIYVTHDQLEAMTLATKICLINNGVLQQYDAPLDVYKRPANLFAADFVGNPAINFIEASGDQQEDGSVALRLLGGRQAVFTPREPIRLADAVKKADLEEKRRAEESARMEKSNKDTVFQYRIQRVDETQQPAEPPEVTDSDFVVGVRPEYLNIHDAGAVEGEIYSAMPTGMETMVKVRVGGLLLTGVVFGGVLYRIGQKIRLDFGGDNIVLFSRKNGRMIARGTLVLR